MARIALLAILIIGAFSVNIHEGGFPHKLHPLEELKKSEWG
jgi:hypothetical protein